MLAVLMVSAAVSGPVADAVTIGQFVENISKLRMTFRTLEVEFTLTRTEAAFRKTAKFTGRLVMLRDRDMKVYGILALTADDDPANREVFVLRAGELYTVDNKNRTARPLGKEAERGGMVAFLANFWLGPIWLLDREQGLNHCPIRVARRGADTTFVVKAVQKPLWELFGGPGIGIERDYWLVTAATGTKEFPVGAIRRLTEDLPNGDRADYRVTRWAVDAIDKLTPAEFPSFESLPLPADWKRFPSPWPLKSGDAK